jgi:iron complex transport system substrate-binding protein
MKKIAVVCIIFVAVAASFGTSPGARSFLDQSRHLIRMERPFERIISLYPAHTENLFSLGLDREIIGVSRDEAFPPEAGKKPVFSYHDDAEKFIAAQPDLVLIRPMIARGYRGLISKLRESGIAVVSLQPRTVDGMFSYWRELGMLTARETEAGQMIQEFKGGLLKIRSIVNSIPLSGRKRVYFEAIHSKMKTFSPSSIAMFALTTAGGINVAADAKAVHILSHGDNIDVYLAQRGTMNQISVERIKEEGGFRAIKAVREGQVYIIDEKIVSRPTLRLLDGIYEIGGILYPKKFINPEPLNPEPVNGYEKPNE